jgi:hypothetical protein
VVAAFHEMVDTYIVENPPLPPELSDEQLISFILSDESRLSAQEQKQLEVVFLAPRTVNLLSSKQMCEYDFSVHGLFASYIASRRNTQTYSSRQVAGDKDRIDTGNSEDLPKMKFLVEKDPGSRS